MSESIPPDWAIERALSELGGLRVYDDAAEVKRYAALPTYNKSSRQVFAFARYIASKEEAPVDPLLEEAREVAAKANETINSCRFASAIRQAAYDEHVEVKIALAALRRGIEIGRDQ